MNRRQLAFLILINALISLAIALGVAWTIEARRPDPEELAALYTPVAAVAAPENLPASLPAAEASDPVVDEPAAQPTAAAVSEPAVEAEATSEEPGEEEVYIVQAGDSLLAIATRYGLTVAELVDANKLDNPDFVFSGQRLVIPRAGGGDSSEAAPTATSTPAATGQGLRIGAVESPGSSLSEAISLVNDSNLAVNLQGWQLAREGGPTYTFESVSIFPGGSLWIHSRAGSNTSVALYWGEENPIWQSGAVIQLRNPQGELVTSAIVP